MKNNQNNINIIEKNIKALQDLYIDIQKDNKEIEKIRTSLQDQMAKDPDVKKLSDSRKDLEESLSPQEDALSEAKRKQVEYEMTWNSAIEQRRLNENAVSQNRINEIDQRISQIKAQQPAKKGILDMMADKLSIGKEFEEREKLIDEKESLSKKMKVSAEDYRKEAINRAQYSKFNKADDNTKYALESGYKVAVQNLAQAVTKATQDIDATKKAIKDNVKQIKKKNEDLQDKFKKDFADQSRALRKGIKEKHKQEEGLKENVDGLIDQAVKAERDRIKVNNDVTYKNEISAVYNAATLASRNAP